MRRFYAPPENFHQTEIRLDAEETKHLRDVLRLSAGARVSVFDGTGKEFSCEIIKIEKRETRLLIVEETAPKASESTLDLTLGVALLKGEKFELVVQKAVELGVSKIVPLVTKRADVKIKDAKEAAKKLERWRKISVDAAKQSGRARLLEIDAPTNFTEFVKISAFEKTSEAARLILFAESGGEKFSAVEKSEKIVALIGSEGGWEASEIDAAREKGFQIVTFAGRILRAETAVIAIAAVLQNQFGDFN